MPTKEDPLHRISRTQTNTFHQHAWGVWQQAEKQRRSPIKTPSKSRSPVHDMLPPKSLSPPRSPARRTPGSRAPHRPGTPDPRVQKVPTLTIEKVRRSPIKTLSKSRSPTSCMPPPKSRSPPRSPARRTPGSHSTNRPGTPDPRVQKAPTLTIEKARCSPIKTPSKYRFPTTGMPPPKSRSPPRSPTHCTSGSHSTNNPRSQEAPTSTTRRVLTPTPSRERPRKFRKSPSSMETNAPSSPRAIASPVGVPTTIFTKRPSRKPALAVRTSFSDDGGDALNEQPPHLVLELVREEKAMELFDSLDDNESGKLSLTELAQGVALLFQVVNYMPAIMRAYKATDKCGDGFVSRSEFPFFWTYLVYYNSLWSVFSLDEDGDRRISRDEWMKAAANEKLVLGAVFDQVDVNGSGKVLIDEFCKYMAEESRPKLVRDEEFVANCSKEEMLGVADGFYIVKDDGEVSHY